jgi:acyl carrier protein
MLIETFSEFANQMIDSKSTINSLKEAGIDSLEMFEAIMEIEESLCIEIPDTVLENDDETITQIANNIYNFMHQAGI